MTAAVEMRLKAKEQSDVSLNNIQGRQPGCWPAGDFQALRAEVSLPRLWQALRQAHPIHGPPEGPQVMTPEEALALPKYARIKVRKHGQKRLLRAFVVGEPQKVGHWVLVGYALQRYDADTMSGQTHTAILGGAYPDHIENGEER
jgi:hypothetical protein